MPRVSHYGSPPNPSVSSASRGAASGVRSGVGGVGAVGGTSELPRWTYTNPQDALERKPVPELNNTLSYPGFLKLTGVEPEDKLTQEQILAGYKAPYFISHDKEYTSFRNSLPGPVKALRPLVIRRMEGLLLEKKSKSKLLKSKRHSLETFKLTHNEGLFPLLSTAALSKKEEFLRGLADPRLRLLKLRLKTSIPHAFNNFATLMESFVEYRVAHPRALWMLKIFYLNHCYNHNDGTLKTRSKTATGEYTKAALDYLKKSLELYFAAAAAAHHAPLAPAANKKPSSASAAASREEEEARRYEALAYTCRFLQMTMRAQLLDRASFLTTLLEWLSDKLTPMDAFLLDYLALFAHDVAASPPHLHKLLALMLPLAARLRKPLPSGGASEAVVASVRASIVALLRVFVRRAPDVFVLLDDRAFAVAWSLLHHMPEGILRDRQRLKQPILACTAIDRIAIIALLNQITLASRVRLNDLWTSIFMGIPLNDPPENSALYEAVAVIAEWACLHAPPALALHRRYLAAALMKLTHDTLLALPSRTRRKRVKHAPEAYPLQQLIVRFLDATSINSDEEVWACARYVGELIRGELFSHVLYGRQLVTRGILKPYGVSFDEPSRFVLKHRRLYAALPLFGKLEEERAERYFNLYGLQHSAEKAECERGEALLQAHFPAPGSLVRVGAVAAPEVVALVRGASSVYVQELWCEWLLNWAVATVRALPSPPHDASVRVAVGAVLHVLEACEEVHALLTLLLWLIRQRALPEPFVLDMLHAYAPILYCERRVVPALADLHAKLDNATAVLASEVWSQRLLTMLAKLFKTFEFLSELQEWQQTEAILNAALKDRLKDLGGLNPSKIDVSEGSDAQREMLAAKLQLTAFAAALLTPEEASALVARVGFSPERKTLATTLWQLLISLRDTLATHLASPALGVLLRNCLELLAALKSTLSLVHASSEVPLAVLKALLATLPTRPVSLTEIEALVALTQLLLLESAVGMPEFFLFVLAPVYKSDVAAMPHPENLVHFLQHFFAPPRVLASIGLDAVFSARLELAAVDAASLFPVVEFLVGALKRRAHAGAELEAALASVALASSWLCATLLREPVWLYDKLKHVKDPLAVRAVFHLLFLHDYPVSAIHTRDDALTLALPLLRDSLAHVTEAALPRVWMTLRLLLDEWYFTLGPQASPAALTSFVDAFLLEALMQPAALPEDDFDEKHAYAQAAVPLLDFRREGLLKYLAQRLDILAPMLAALKSVVEQHDPTPPRASALALVKSAIARTIPSFDENLVVTTDAQVEERLLWLVHVSSSALEASKSGLEELVRKQLDALRDALIALQQPRDDGGAGEADPLLAHLDFLLRLLVLIAPELCQTKSPQLVSRRDDLVKALLALVRVPLLRTLDPAAWTFAVHVFGLLVAPDADRFSMTALPFTRTDRPPFKKALYELLNPAPPENAALPVAARTRIEQLVPAVHVSSSRLTPKMPDLSSATMDTIDPWLVLEDQPEPVLLPKIDKAEKPFPRQELSFAKTLFLQKRTARAVVTPQAPVVPTPVHKLATPNAPFTPNLGGTSATPLPLQDELQRGLDLRFTSPVPTPPTKPRGDYGDSDERLSTPRYPAPTPARPSYTPSHSLGHAHGQVPPPRPNSIFSPATRKRPATAHDASELSPSKKPRTDTGHQ